MFIGSTYKLRDRKAPTSLGFTLIHIKDRVLSRTETRQRTIEGISRSVTSYHYTLMCLVDVHDSAEISEDDLVSEVTSGYYDLVSGEV